MIKRGILGLCVVAALAVGCSSATVGKGQSAATGAQGDGDGAGGDGSGESATRTPVASNAAGVDANTQYVPEADPSRGQEIITRMWGVMTSAPCWYMQNSTNNYQFYGYNEYRYAGYETTAGQLVPLSAGKFGPYDTAEAQIGGSQYWIAVIDAQTITVSFVHDNGKFVLNYFTAAAPGQVCI